MAKQPFNKQSVDPALADKLGLELWQEAGNAPPDLNRMKDLIAQGANMEVQKEGLTPLIRAALRERNDAAFLLLDSGAQPDTVGDHGQTALIISSGPTGNFALVKKLLDKGATPDHSRFHTKTALMWAAHRGFRDIAIQIANRGGDILLKSSGPNPKNAIEWAEDNNKALMAELLHDLQARKEHLARQKAEEDRRNEATARELAAKQEFEAAVLENVRTHKPLVAPRRASFKKRTEPLNQQ